MSRPIKWRKICCMPLNKTFAPSGSKPQGKITMTIDEYETIRLMDLENCTQEGTSYFCKAEIAPLPYNA